MAPAAENVDIEASPLKKQALDAVANRVKGNVGNHLSFLRHVDSHADVLYSPRVLRLAVARYEHLWLPLCAKKPMAARQAPLDIEFMWHCHLLNPVRCALPLFVCRKRAGCVVCAFPLLHCSFV